jgi:hypothetical protein
MDLALLRLNFRSFFRLYVFASLHVVNEKDKFLITLAENKKLFTIFGELSLVCLRWNKHSRLPQWGLTWLNQVQCYYQHLYLVDPAGAGLRNPHCGKRQTVSGQARPTRLNLLTKKIISENYETYYTNFILIPC